VSNKNYNPKRNFNFREKINDMKRKKNLCMTPKPKIIINQGGNEEYSMNGGHSNNYTSKYLINKALDYNNNKISRAIGEGVDSTMKVNIRGKQHSVLASINNTQQSNNKDTINNKKEEEDKEENEDENHNNNEEIKEEINTIEDNKKSNGNNSNRNNRNKGWMNLIKRKAKYTCYEKYKRKEELERRLVRIRKSYQEKEFNQCIMNMKTFIYIILPGNASYLVKNCMSHRVNWKEPYSNVTSLYNFKWQQLSLGIDYNSLGNIFNIKQIVNHYENHYVISNKANMFINLMDYCEKSKLSVFKYVPFTIIFQFKDKANFNNNNDIIKTEGKRLEELKFFITNANKFITNYEDIGKFFNEEKYKEDQIKRKKFEIEKNKLKKKKLKIEEGISAQVGDANGGGVKELKYESDVKVYNDFFPKINVVNKIPTIIKDKDGNIIEELKEKENKKKSKYIGKSTVVEIPNTHNCGKNMWIIKAINLNRGMCIRIVNSFDQIEKIIQKFKEGVNYGFTNDNIDIDNPPTAKTTPPVKEEIKPENNNTNTNDKNTLTNENEEEKNYSTNKKEKMYYCSMIIIQKYIEKPLLYKGRKCDIRIWVLLTQSMEVYVFKEGHLKTCSVEFDINSKDAFTHITNYSFQKYNNNFQKYEKGNEVPFFEFQKFIDEKYPNKNYKLNKDLMNDIKEIISISMKSVKKKINKNKRNFQFEIFGYDFMLDENFNIFLIEINTNPGFEESSPWIKIIVPRMIDDALRLTLDKLFEPEYDFSLNYKKPEDLEHLETFFNNLEYSKNADTINSNTNNNNEKNKNKNVNNKKYISPFPVPGYTQDENLWDFVCDLNSKDINEEEHSEKEEKKNHKEQTFIPYTGIKRLLFKKHKTKELKSN